MDEKPPQRILFPMTGFLVLILIPACILFKYSVASPILMGLLLAILPATVSILVIRIADNNQNKPWIFLLGYLVPVLSILICNYFFLVREMQLVIISFIFFAIIFIGGTVSLAFYTSKFNNNSKIWYQILFSSIVITLFYYYFRVIYLNQVIINPLYPLIVAFFLVSIYLGFEFVTQKNISEFIRIVFGCVSLLLPLFILILMPIYLDGDIPYTGALVTGYKIKLENPNFDVGIFFIQEEVEYNAEYLKNLRFTKPSDWGEIYYGERHFYKLPPREIHSEKLNVFLREVHITPPLSVVDKNVFPDSIARDPVPCCGIDVELIGIPAHSFYQAKYINEIEAYKYLNVDKVSWKEPGGKVIFAYVQPPFNFLRPLLDPFLSFNSIPQAVFNIIGAFGGALFVYFAKTVFEEKFIKKEKPEKVSHSVRSSSTIHHKPKEETRGRKKRKKS